MYNGWTVDAGGDHSRIIMNATIWLTNTSLRVGDEENSNSFVNVWPNPFRDELNADAKKYSSLWDAEKTPAKSTNLENCQEANYYLQRVNSQIEYFERQGIVLSSIEIPKEEVKERTFTETEISHLQSEGP